MSTQVGIDEEIGERYDQAGDVQYRKCRRVLFIRHVVADAIHRNQCGLTAAPKHSLRKDAGSRRMNFCRATLQYGRMEPSELGAPHFRAAYKRQRREREGWHQSTKSLIRL